jgi:hypothetical protein
MFIVYLTVDFFQLYIDIMQKLLNTHSFALYPPLARMLSNAKGGLLTALTFLLLVGLTTPVQAADFTNNYISISGTSNKPNVNGSYYTKGPSTTAPKPFNGLALGDFDLGNGNLFLTAYSNTAGGGANDIVGRVVLLYRVYLTSATTKPGFQELTLSTTPGTDFNDKNKSWVSSQPNILRSVTTPGAYTIDLYYRGDIVNKKGTATSTIFDGNATSYSATFTTSGRAPATWAGTSMDDDWNNPDNWNPKELPDSKTDVTIPSNTPSYPHIVSSEKAAVARTLIIQGFNGGRGATVTIEQGNLLLYGDLQDPYNGLTQTGVNGVLTLAGSNQTFSAVRLNNMVIQGGGDKLLAEKNIVQGEPTPVRMEIYATLRFNNDAGGGRIVTGTANSVTNGVSLSSDAQVIGESEGSYVKGIVSTSRTIASNQLGSVVNFGGIGMSLVANNNAPGRVNVVRYTGSSFPSVGTKGASVNRYFVVTPNNPNNINYTLSFKYLDSELNGNDGANLGLFTAANSDNTNTFVSLGRSANSDRTTRTLSVTNIPNTLAATFTLGQIAPLPVTLVSFTATPTPQGAALLRWVTAKELNNKGFGIERTLGTDDTWKEVSYVATTNTPNGKSYEYTDKSLITAPASTQAYYRLRQEDLDGTISYSPVAVVARQAVVANTNLVLSPVPVDGPNLSVSFAEAGQAGQEVAVINTQGQRMLHFTTQGSADGTLNLPVANLAAGVYIVRIQTPGQAVRHARFVKL